MPTLPGDTQDPKPQRRPPTRRRRYVYDLRTRPDRMLITMFSMLRDEASKPYVVERITLNTDQSQKIFHRVFTKLSDAQYRSDTILTQVAPTDAITLHRKMDKGFEDIYQKLTKEEQRIDVLIQSEGIVGEAKYTQSSMRDAIIYSPRAKRFLLLLEIYDRMVAKLDMLHLHGIIRTDEWVLVTYDWRRQLFAYANVQIDASNEAMRAARQRLEKEARELRESFKAGSRRVKSEAGGADDGLQNGEGGPSEEEFLKAVQLDLSDISRVSEHDETDEDAGTP